MIRACARDGRVSLSRPDTNTNHISARKFRFAWYPKLFLAFQFYDIIKMYLKLKLSILRAKLKAEVLLQIIWFIPFGPSFVSTFRVGTWKNSSLLLLIIRKAGLCARQLHWLGGHCAGGQNVRGQLFCRITRQVVCQGANESIPGASCVYHQIRGHNWCWHQLVCHWISLWGANGAQFAQRYDHRVGAQLDEAFQCCIRLTGKRSSYIIRIYRGSLG